MKLLSQDLLKEYGFTEDPIKSNQAMKVMTRDKVDIVFKDQHFYYSNMGIDYPLIDVIGLCKLYKELRTRELIPVRAY